MKIRSLRSEANQRWTREKAEISGARDHGKAGTGGAIFDVSASRKGIWNYRCETGTGQGKSQ